MLLINKLFSVVSPVTFNVPPKVVEPVPTVKSFVSTIVISSLNMVDPVTFKFSVTFKDSEKVNVPFVSFDIDELLPKVIVFPDTVKLPVRTVES